MFSPKSVTPLVLVVALVFTGAACDREVSVVEQTNTPASCFDCHSDNNTALVAAEAQYENSFHASGRTIHENSAGCAGCHTSEGFVTRVTGGTVTAVENPTAIHCFTCHAPHTNGDFRLRVTAPATLMNGVSRDIGSANICATCHYARRGVNTYVSQPTNINNNRWGPHHSVQGDWIFGSNGYEYSGYNYRRDHAHRTATDDGCLDCHFRTTSQYVVGGHSFNMEGETHGEEVLNTAACEACHGELDDFNYHNVQDSVMTLVGTLRTLLVNAGLVSNTTGLPIGPQSVSADTAGAVWNYLLAEEDRSEGVHNPTYYFDILNSSIEFMQGTRRSASQPPALAQRKDAPGPRR